MVCKTWCGIGIPEVRRRGCDDNSPYVACVAEPLGWEVVWFGSSGEIVEDVGGGIELCCELAVGRSTFLEVKVLGGLKSMLGLLADVAFLRIAQEDGAGCLERNDVAIDGGADRIWSRMSQLSW